MTNHRLIEVITFVACGCTCVAYEAIWINGWYNRFQRYGWNQPFSEFILSQWKLGSLLVYILIFSAFAVVFYNKRNPKIRFSWFLFSVVMLIISCVNIPNAFHGRWSSTDNMLELFYWLVVPIPSIIFIVIGIRSENANKAIKKDV